LLRRLPLYNAFSHDGFLSDKFLVNGVIQPFHHVSGASIASAFWTAPMPALPDLPHQGSGQTMTFDQIATEAGLMSAPIRKLESLFLSRRFEGHCRGLQGLRAGDRGLPENRLIQTTAVAGWSRAAGTPLLKFIVEGPKVEDPSQVPDHLRRFDKFDADKAAPR